MASYFVNRLKAWLQQEDGDLPPSDERILRCRPGDLKNLPLGDLEYLKTLDPQAFQQHYLEHFLAMLAADENVDTWQQRLQDARSSGYSDMSDLIVGKALERYGADHP